jgi:prepilin-type N-terminal cleavage/methylation domain-containing protein
VIKSITARLRQEGGFTLIELMSSMIVLGVLFAAFATVMGSTIRTGSEVESNSVLQTQVRAAVDTLAADLRQAYSGNDTVAPIESMSGTAIQFTSPDKQQPFHLRRIGYQLASGSFDRRFATSTNTSGYPWTFPALSSWVQQVPNVVAGTVFTYLKSDGTTATLAKDVDSVTISLTVATITTTTRTYTYKTSVTLRTPQPA